MRDVLEVISKLPPACLVWEDGQAYVIHRGVMGRTEYPMPSELGVTIWNFEHKVTPEQVTAMQAGSHFGWDCEAADLPITGDTTFIYSAPLQVMLSINANREEDAARHVETSLNKLVEYLQDTRLDHVLTIVRDGKLDLVEENKNA